MQVLRPLMVAFTLTSSNFEVMKDIPLKHTCDGQDISPALEWAGPPSDTKSFALIMYDPDIPSGIVNFKGNPITEYDHWVLFNLPPTTTHLKEGIAELPDGSKMGLTSNGKAHYVGPCPPDKRHRYFFKLYALDALLPLDTGATRHAVEEALKDHILAETTLIGTYDRPR